MSNGDQPPIESVAARPVEQPVRPHRGVLVLVMGILGLVCCVIFGIIAWVLGNTDIREMNAGRMDPSGRGLTQAGKICGIISVILWVVSLVVGLFWAIVGAGRSVSV